MGDLQARMKKGLHWQKSSWVGCGGSEDILGGRPKGG